MIRREKIRFPWEVLEGLNRLPKFLLLGDGLFIIVHAFYILGLIHNPAFSVETDFGYAEMYQYLKQSLIAIFLFWLAVKNRQLIYLSWSTLFGLLTLDDALSIHEDWGGILVKQLGLQPALGLRAQDFGELAIFSLYGVFLLIFVGGVFWFSDRKAKQVTKSLVALIGLLAFFAGVVDMLHVAISWGGYRVTSLLGLLEDGGEMITISLILAYIARPRWFAPTHQPTPELGR